MSKESGAAEDGSPEEIDWDAPFDWGTPRGHSAVHGLRVPDMAPPPPSVTTQSLTPVTPGDELLDDQEAPG